MSDTWKRCPFCNASAVYGVRVHEEVLDDKSVKIYSECSICGARGPSTVTGLYESAKVKVALAKAAWNGRGGAWYGSKESEGN